MSAGSWKFHIALVHNRQPARDDYLVPRLRELAARLGASLSLVSWQPEIAPHSTWTTFARALVHFVDGLRWSIYCRSKMRNLARLAWTFFSATLPKFAFRPRELARARRSSFIETVVTAKHVLAWRQFLETDADFLICCEDDLVFKPDSAERLDRLIASGDLTRDVGLRYIDLAGGLPIPALQIGRLLFGRGTDGAMIFRPATTNTACCYVLSRALASQFVDVMIRHPKLRLIGIDWMINAILMTLARRGVECDAVHFVPTIFGHGTFTGAYVSWTQKPDPGNAFDVVGSSSSPGVGNVISSRDAVTGGQGKAFVR